MKRIILLAVMAVCLVGCRMSQQERAEKLVEMYLDDTENDPKSVEVLSVNIVKTKKEMDADANWVIRHYGFVTYRSKNEYGALMKKTVPICFNEEVTQLVCWDCSAH